MVDRVVQVYVDGVVQVYNVVVYDNGPLYDGAFVPKEVAKLGYFSSYSEAARAGGIKASEHNDWEAKITSHHALRLPNGRTYLLASIDSVPVSDTAEQALRNEALNKLSPAERRALNLPT